MNYPGGLRPDMYDLNSGILFKDVHFTYPSRPDMPIFKGLNLDVPAGSITAVVGPSGSGKSTLGSLLLRLYDPEEGQVIVGGHDVRTLSPDWLRGAVGTVHQVCISHFIGFLDIISLKNLNSTCTFLCSSSSKHVELTRLGHLFAFITKALFNIKRKKLNLSFFSETELAAKQSYEPSLFPSKQGYCFFSRFDHE